MNELNSASLLAKLDVYWPEGALHWTLFAGGFSAAVVLAVIVYIRDARRLSPVAMVWMLLLRLSVFAALAAIALNPFDRIVRPDFNPSRVVVLVDRSLSMDLGEKNAASDSQGQNRKRYMAVSELLAGSPMIEQLRKNHDVSIYTFNSRVERDFKFLPGSRGGEPHGSQEDKPHGSQRDEPRGSQGDEQKDPAKPIDWASFLNPLSSKENRKPQVSKTVKSTTKKASPESNGQADPGIGSPNETRLGEVLHALLREKKGKTLSAVVIITDGQSNIGLDPAVAHKFARDNKIRLITVGLGGLERPVNVRLMSIRAPTEVNKDNPFDITAVVQGTGMAGRSVDVRLFVKPEQAPDSELKEVKGATEANTTSVNIEADDKPAELTFHLNPKETGRFKYVVKITPSVAGQEFDTKDNEDYTTIEVRERNLGVLIIAGGPMREYRFARNMLFRHKGINVDVWLQSADPAKIEQISQDCDDLLTQFPENFPTRPIVESPDAEKDPKRAEKYDVVIAFDPDWNSDGFDADSFQKLEDWVSRQSGGLIAVAGDVNTPNLAAAGEKSPLKTIQNMYPVVLGQFFGFDDNVDQKPQVWKITPTEQGRSAKFLQLADSELDSDEVWKDFDGLYRCYPTIGRKAAAVVYAYFGDPALAAGDFGAPILIASQIYGVGRVIYLGSPEMWRLRALDEDYYDHFWVKIVWEAGLGRMNLKSAYGSVMLQRNEYFIGESVRVLAHLQDIKNQPVRVPSVEMELIDPNGDLVLPSPKLHMEENQPGYYAGYFPARLKGEYRLKVMNPSVEGEPGIEESVKVRSSDRETLDPRQNSKLLKDLARDTGGRYLSLSDFGKVFSTVADKEKRLEDLKQNNPDPSSVTKATAEFEEAENVIKRLFPNRSETIPVDERIKTLWDVRLVMFLLVALLSVEWLTRKLLKLA